MVYVQSISYVQRVSLSMRRPTAAHAGNVSVDRSDPRQPTLLSVCHTAPHLLCMYVHNVWRRKGYDWQYLGAQYLLTGTETAEFGPAAQQLATQLKAPRNITRNGVRSPELSSWDA